MRSSIALFQKVSEFYNSGRYTYQAACDEARRLHPDLYDGMMFDDAAHRAQFTNTMRSSDPVHLAPAMVEQNAMLAAARAALVGQNWIAEVRLVESKLKGRYASELFNAIVKKLQTDGGNTFEQSWQAAERTFSKLRDGIRQNPLPPVIANEMENRQAKVIELVNEAQAKNPSLTYDDAFNQVQRDNPAIFKAMKQPDRLKAVKQ